ncbi:MAG: hypothetical protein WCP46_06050 [Alphaproteobacteria bacterium]|jgi:hypothetical protein
MAKDELEESEYVVIKKWYQKTEEAMDKAWRTGDKGHDIEKAGHAMFEAVSDLLRKLAPDIDLGKLGEVQKQFLPILKKAQEEFKKQKDINGEVRFTREDGILPAMIQSFFHTIAKFFRGFNPTVADLMEDAAKIVYEEKKNSAEYTKSKVAQEQYAEQSRERQERADSTFRLQSTSEEIAARKATAERLQNIFDGKPPVATAVLNQATLLGAQALSGGTPSSTSSPQTQNIGHGRSGNLGVAKK